MGQFRDISIKNVMEELNVSFFLPDIQREFVWLRKEKERQIEQLFDSILRGYPIGSFLFWKLKRNDIETNKNAEPDSDKLNFQLYKFIENYDERSKHNDKINIEQINSDNLSIVLDGQQRLTSLYIGLKGTRTLRKYKGRKDNPNAFIEKSLFINLRYQPNDENPDDNFEFTFLKKDTIPGHGDDKFWYKVGDILSIGSVLAYARKNDLGDSEAEILELLKDAFCTKSLVSYFEETEKNLDKVLKIFIRVNSGGTQLSYSDLLMSILTANFSSDIRDLMTKFVDSIKVQGFGVMGRDQVLKTCLLLTDSNHVFKLRNFSKHNINKIESEWGSITKNIYDAIDVLKDFGYRDRLSSAYIISVVSYYLSKNEKITKEDRKEMARFVRNAQITGYFTSSLDGKLEVVAKQVRKSESFSEVNKRLAKNKIQPLRISSDDVERMVDIKYGNPAVLPVLQMLYPDLDYKNSIFHIDHIFPKSRFRQSNKGLPEYYLDKANFLFNLQLLEGDENMSKKAKSPEDWLEERFGGDDKAVSLYKIKNYIPDAVPLKWENMSEFDEKRSEAIVDKLKELFS